jgi:predicted ATPase
MISAHPLTYEQIGTLVSYLPQQLIATIQTQASGNPLFAEELARVVSTGGQGKLDTFFLSQDNISSSASILPDAITAVLERRLHRLSSGCRTLLGRAAVLGNAFELGQLQPMAPEHNEDAILDFLEEALHAGLLTEEGTGTRVKYRFWHPLITSYLYSHLSAARRAQLQRRAAMLATPKNER